MSEIQYKLDYDDGAARQVGTEVVHASAPRVESRKRKRKFRIPAAANTAITVVVCGGLFFAAVAFAPKGWRPQDFTGQYAEGITEAIKSREAEIQGRLDAYNTQLKASAEQHNMQFNQKMQATLDLYKALYAINQSNVEAANNLRGMYVQQSITQAAQSNGANMSVATLAELIGQGQNILDPGSGDAALAEAERQRGIARGRIKDAAVTSAAVDISSFSSKLPTPEQLQAQLTKIEPFDPPEMPRFVKVRR